MEIGPHITRAVLTVDETDSFAEAAIWMMERGVGSAVVLDEAGKPTGIITDRDALRVVARNSDPNITVRDTITRGLKTVTPELDVLEAARLMRDKGFRHLVVVDAQGALYGVFSMRDLVVGLLEERASVAAQLS